MTIAPKEIVGELSGLSVEKQQVAASVIHALWNEEHSSDTVHPEWKAELGRRNEQPVQLVKEIKQPIPASKKHAKRVDYEYDTHSITKRHRSLD